LHKPCPACPGEERWCENPLLLRDEFGMSGGDGFGMFGFDPRRSGAMTVLFEG
jgi:hypothetical protein